MACRTLQSAKFARLVELFVILMHERLEHFPFPQEEDGDDIILKACGPGQGVSRSIPEKMNPTTELVELFANTTIQHERGSKYVEWENMDTGCVSHKYISHVTIGDAKIVVDGDLSVGTERGRRKFDGSLYADCTRHRSCVSCSFRMEQ